MIDASLHDNYLGIHYNLMIDLAGIFQINSVDDKISLLQLDTVLEMKNRRYNKLFSAKENIIIQDYIACCNTVEVIDIFDKVGKIDFGTLCREMVSKYCVIKRINLSAIEIEKIVKYIYDNRNSNSLTNNKYSSYLDPKGTWKKKSLERLHNERVAKFKKGNLKKLEKTEALVFINPKADRIVYTQLRDSYLENFESEVHYQRFMEYVRVVLNSYSVLLKVYNKQKVSRLLTKYGFEDKMVCSDAKDVTDIKKNILLVLRNNISQEELNKIIERIRKNELNFDSAIFKIITQIVHLQDFYERSFKLFKKYYKIDVIVCLVVLYSVIDGGKSAYDI